MNDTICTCVTCTGPDCTCGCQNEVAGCLCGETCNCGPACDCN